MPRPRPRGVTLIELLVVLAIVGLIGSLAALSLNEAIARHRLRVAADDLLGTLLKARSTAVWRDHEIRVCASGDGRICSPSADWTRGWIGRDMHSGDILTFTPALDGKLGTLRRSGRHEIDFARNGTAPGTNQTIVLCVRGRPATAIAVTVSNAGLPRRKAAAPDDAALCAKALSRRR
ncbi:GspH/FimT family pseudopilin [Luteibacter sp.]|jgi:type IV fimbrial biogenesis protein FimT|uniref:GspH/FimT family pseudopilin n=1 Tax=Luteibacter sp. TaxID=1886636 RepID=UPI002F41D85E